jgi:Sugar phosphate isomerases/epimerases
LLGDPVEFLQAVVEHVVHVRAKDISIEQSVDERGKVTGTPVGCACGEGVIDWHAIIKVLKDAGYNGVLSVECGTEEHAAKSINYLRSVLEEVGA